MSVCVGEGGQNLDTKGIPAASDETVWGRAGRAVPGQAESLTFLHAAGFGSCS